MSDAAPTSTAPSASGHPPAAAPAQQAQARPGDPPQVDIAQSSPGPDGPVGTINQVVGSAIVTRADGTVVVVVSPGVQINRGDIINTPPGASIEIGFNNSAQFFLGENGRALVEAVGAQAGGTSSSLLFVLQGAFGVEHRSNSFSGEPAMVVRTPVATVHLQNGRLAGRAAPEAVDNVFTLLRGGDGLLGFARVVTAGGAILLQNELASAQVLSLFREPTPLPRPDLGDFLGQFGPGVAGWSQVPEFSPAAGPNAAPAPVQPPASGPEPAPGSSESGPAGAPGLSDGGGQSGPGLDPQFVTLPEQPDAPPSIPVDAGANNPSDPGPVDGSPAPLDPVVRTDFDGGDREVFGTAGIDTLHVSANPVAPSNIEITNVGGKVQIRNVDTGVVITASAFEELQIDLGSARDSITIGSLAGTDIADNTIIIDARGGDDVIDAEFAGKRVVVDGGAGNDTLTGGSSNDTLIGGDGNDTLDGKGGADEMTGGAGDDVFFVDNAGDQVIESANAGTDTVNSTIGYTLAANVENLVLAVGAGSIDGTGNALANAIAGNEGDNLLDGGGGVDTLTGGLGNDTYRVDETADVVVEAVGEGTDTVESAATSYTLSANVENLTLTGSGNIDGTGNASANVLAGNSGNNTLDGGTGADAMAGGLGDDTYIVDDAGDTVSEQPGEGADTVQASVSYAITDDDVENLTLTGSGNIDGTGNASANVLAGNSGNNTLDGGAGADAMAGGLGNDTYIVDNAGDTVSEQPGEGADTVEASVSYAITDDDVENLTLTGSGNIDGTGNASANVVTGNSGNNTLTGGGGADTLLGNGGADTLIGGEGNDMLDGGTGADAMSGGLGNDTYIVDDAGDTVSEQPGEGADTVQASVSYAITDDDVENLTLTGSGNIDGTGNASANVLAGNAGNNTLDGGAGADAMAGGLGNDTYIVDNAGDTVSEEPGEGADTVQASVSYAITDDDVENLTLTGSDNIDGTGNASANVVTGNSGNNTLTGGGGADTLLGNGGADTLIGGDGNDMLDGGAGADAMAGGLGDDTYIVDDVGDTVSEEPGEGADTVQASVSYAITDDDVENLTLTGSGNIDGTGNASANVVTGNSGNNTLTGGGGADTLLGNGGADTLIGGDGNDMLDGGTGADAMAGGLGDDTYIVDDAGDTVSEEPGEGADTVQASVSYTIIDPDVENLTLTGTENRNGTGNASANVITGNSGNNVLAGGAGDDVISGAGGADTVTYASVAGGGVTVDLSGGTAAGKAGSDAGSDTLSSIENIIGSNFFDTLTGDGGANVIDGGAGDDLIDGGAGADTLFGGSEDDTINGGTGNDTINGGAGDDDIDGGDGVDTVTYASVTGAGVTVDLNTGGLNSIGNGGSNAGSDSLTNIENVIGTVFDDDITGDGNANTLSGGAGADTIAGGGGNDVLDGGAGVDTMTGGLGDDTYFVDEVADAVVEAPGEGTDTVVASVSYSIELLNDVENITLSNNQVLTATGNDGANILTGNNLASTLVGNDGDDTYVISNGATVITEQSSEGTDTVQSSASYTLASNVENLTLTGSAGISGTGNSGNNTIVGNAGANSINGGAGDDMLTGGGNADTFVFGTGFGNDTMADFVTGTDKIDLSALGPLTFDTIIANTTDSGSGAVIALTDGTITLTGVDRTDLSTGDFTGLTAATGGNDTIGGGANDDAIAGLGGDDILSGGAGDDTLAGGDGADTLTGGDGNDRFYYAAPTEGGDSVTDFASGDDAFVFLRGGFDNIATVDGANFATIGTAYDGTNGGLGGVASFVYSTFDNTLTYDADGSGAGNGFTIAQITGGDPVTAASVTMVDSAPV